MSDRATPIEPAETLAGEPLGSGRSEPSHVGDSEQTLPGHLDEPVASRALPEVGGRISRYIVLGPLGRGGMGTVLRAYDEGLDRAVAIKLLNPGAAERHAKRLTREAQALAKLSHPNVVQVYEVGEVDGQWFIAMELIRGLTLRQWHNDEHDWRECVKLYLEMGAGLAAAHAAGLVHRDFKPDNCIIDEQGRPRILDFGLVREVGPTEIDASHTEGASIADLEPSSALTRAGAVLGTVAYMSLEQLAGEPADARSDQFSFCVTLYESLYGQRPFADETVGSLTAALVNSAVRPIPKGTRVPVRLRKVLLRGLAADPDERFADMPMLLAELRRVLAPRRAYAPTLVLGGGLALLGLGLLYEPGGTAPCQGAEEQLARVWDESRRQELSASFRATEISYAEDAARRAVRALDDYAAAWVDVHTEVCEATSVRKEQSSEVLDLRMVCLERKKVEMAEAVGILTQANRTRVDKAMELVLSLRAPSQCDDVELLRARLPLPSDPAQAHAIREQRRALGRVEALANAVEYAQALVEVEAVKAEAEALGYEPLLAETLYRLGKVRMQNGHGMDAMPDLERAFVLATELGYTQVSTDAATSLTFLLGQEESRGDASLQWGMVALASSRGPGVDGSAEGLALNAIGSAWKQQGELDQALEHYGRARELFGTEGAGSSLLVAVALNNIGDALQSKGAYDEALESFQEALTIRKEIFGEHHPVIGHSLLNMGAVVHQRGRLEEALEFYRRALRLWESALGDEHPLVGRALGNIGVVLKDQGRFADALGYHRRALHLWEETKGPHHPRVATELVNMGVVLSAQGNNDQTLEHYRRALKIFEQTLGPRHLHVGMLLNNIGSVMQIQGKHDDAVPYLERGLEIKEATLGTEHPTVAISLLNLAVLSSTREDPAMARAYAERALAIMEPVGGPAVALGETRFVLAQALGADPRQGERALQLARQARESFAALGEGHAAQLEDVERWLEERGELPVPPTRRPAAP